MQFLADIETAIVRLMNERQASDARVAAAEADAATLKQQIAADEITLKTLLDTVNTEFAAEQSPTPAAVPAGAAAA